MTNSKPDLAVSINIADATVDQLFNQLSVLRNSGRGHYKVMVDHDQKGDALQANSMQIIDATQTVELTNS